MSPQRIVFWIAFAASMACVIAHAHLFPDADRLSVALLLGAGVAFGTGSCLREYSRP